MSRDYLISVVIPVYNSRPYLQKCLDSLLNQTFDKIEIIAVDDGSTDGSSQILDTYSESFPNLIAIHQSNQGQGAARNTGVSAARGEYIGFVDSDDYISTDMYERLYSLIIESSADVAVCRANSVDMNGVVGKPLDCWNKYGNAVLDRHDFLKRDFLNNECSPVLWDKLIRRDIVKCHPSSDLRRGQDFVAWIDYLSEVNRIAFTSERLYYYRHHPDSVMATPESEAVILSDFKTETVAVSRILSYFGDTALAKLYINRIITEWENRIAGYPKLSKIRNYIEALQSCK